MNTAAQAPPLYWRAHDSVEWWPVELYPEVTPGFKEARHVEFATSGDGLQLYVDDEPLPQETNAKTVWSWAPGFFAGEVDAYLMHGDRVVGRYRLDVSPEPTKLGGDAFEQMIDELWDANPALVVGTEPSTSPVGELGQFEDPWLAFARVREHTPAFLQSLRAISTRPRRRLRQHRGSAQPHHARRVDRQTVVSALRGPAASLLLRGDAGAGVGLMPNTRLDVPIVEDTLDCAPNRTLFVLARGVARRIEQLRTKLEELVSKAQDSETRTALAPRWPARRRVLDTLAAELRVLLRREPYCAVTRPEVSAAGLTAMAADPVYARAWRQGWRVLRPAGDGDRERTWLSPTWEIYERWCFLALGRALAEQPDWAWTWTDAHHRLAGQRGSTTVELLLQPTFHSSATPKPAFWSISREREPDIVLHVKNECAESRIVIFDAKYRTSRAAVLDAMSSAHIYQDSLRVGKRRPDASVLLVPAAGGAPWLEGSEFQATHRVGVVALRVQDTLRLSTLIGSLLNSLGA